MSDYGVIYLIDTQYNAERDATEVTLGYLEKEDGEGENNLAQGHTKRART